MIVFITSLVPAPLRATRVGVQAGDRILHRVAVTAEQLRASIHDPGLGLGAAQCDPGAMLRLETSAAAQPWAKSRPGQRITWGGIGSIARGGACGDSS